MKYAVILSQLADTLIFSLVGLVVCALFFIIVVHICPISIRKQIEQEHNVALGIIIGAAIIGIAIIIGAAMHG
jgi:uncharacterized membrane protein YjfL (UPF0719 family)